MKRTAPALALLVCLLAGVSSATPPRGEGVVSGVIRLCGGPAPGRCFTQNGVVTVTSSEGKVVATEHTKHAKFSFDLQPGTYALEARTGGTRGKQTVLARRGKTTTANVVIPIP